MGEVDSQTRKPHYISAYFVKKESANSVHNDYLFGENEVSVKEEIKEGKIKHESDIFKMNVMVPFPDEEKCSKNIISKWIPPISPHNLIEEKFYHDPWALLVVTIFLNRTSCRMALPYIENFFTNFKGPYDILKTEITELEPYFINIGLVRTRATQVWRMSYDFVHKEWTDVNELYGVGKYAEDAYRIFHLGDFSVEPTDRYLKIYKAWYQMTQSHRQLGYEVPNSQVYLEDYYVPIEHDEDESSMEKAG
ncbi:hypothetical protein HHI36_022751 [Cryptolaemus montrouzieri]|uniref:Uncharacterized protein n=1 Tax=Cryptolaemus montrouzieri TaxID=559131 RepID=A0ABD2N1A7_9CUCU